MRALRRFGKLLAIALLVASLVGAGSADAHAATVAARSVPAADAPDFTPSPNKWRQWLLNITSSVLGGAMPSAWRAEQIGNAHKYNAGAWDMMNAQLGIDGLKVDSSGNITGIKYSNRGQGTYVDVAIAGLEQQFTETGKKGGTGGKPMTPPATKPLRLAKMVGGVLTAYTAFEVGNMLGAGGVNALGGVFGYDAQGIVCSNTGSDIVGSATRYLSGQDCSMFSFDPGYALNADAPVQLGDLTIEGRTIKFIGIKNGNGHPLSMPAACYSITGWVSGGGWSLGYMSSTNGWTGSGAPNSGAAQTCTPITGVNHFAYGASGTTNSGPPDWIGWPALSMRQTVGGQVVNFGTQPTTKGDPDRQQECVVKYTDGSSLSSLGSVYKESSGAIAPAQCPGTPAGKTPQTVTTNDKQLGGGPTTKVGEQAVTPEYKDWWQQYPECRTGACKLELFKTTPGAVPVSCFDLEQGCNGWAEDPSKAENYTCRYGVHDVELSECNAYANLFKPGAIEAGAAYADPTTGTWSGGQTSPKSGASAMNSTIQDPANPRSCDMSGMGFDPIGWVLRPMQCWAEWGFIPRPTVAEVAMAGVKDVWQDKPPGAIAAVASQVQISGAATGCSIMTTYKGVTTPLVDACGGWMSVLATFTRWVTLGLMAVLVYGKVRQQIAAMVNYNRGQD